MSWSVTETRWDGFCLEAKSHWSGSQTPSIIETTEAGTTHAYIRWSSQYHYNGEIWYYIGTQKWTFLPSSCFAKSDTEVILAAFRKWGKDCVPKLRGMFAFVIWDELNQTFICLHDRFESNHFINKSLSDSFLHLSVKLCYLFFPKVRWIMIQRLPPSNFLWPAKLFQRYSLSCCRLIVSRSTVRYEDREILGGTLSHRFSPYRRVLWRQTEWLLEDSIQFHLRSDAGRSLCQRWIGFQKCGCVYRIQYSGGDFMGFTVNSGFSQDYDESRYAQLLCENKGFPFIRLISQNTTSSTISEMSFIIWIILLLDPDLSANLWYPS